MLGFMALPYNYINYNISHIELLLNDVCLTNIYEESLTTLALISTNFEFTNALPFISETRPG
jgi:hypothetical protein